MLPGKAFGKGERKVARRARREAMTNLGGALPGRMRMLRPGRWEPPRLKMDLSSRRLAAMLMCFFLQLASLQLSVSQGPTTGMSSAETSAPMQRGSSTSANSPAITIKSGLCSEKHRLAEFELCMDLGGGRFFHWNSPDAESGLIPMAFRVPQFCDWMAVGWSPDGSMMGDCVLWSAGDGVVSSRYIASRRVEGILPTNSFAVLDASFHASSVGGSILRFARNLSRGDGSVKLRLPGINIVIWAHSEAGVANLSTLTYHGDNRGSFALDYGQGATALEEEDAQLAPETAPALSPAAAGSQLAPSDEESGAPASEGVPMESTLSPTTMAREPAAALSLGATAGSVPQPSESGTAGASAGVPTDSTLAEGSFHPPVPAEENASSIASSSVESSISPLSLPSEMIGKNDKDQAAMTSETPPTSLVEGNSSFLLGNRSACAPPSRASTLPAFSCMSQLGPGVRFHWASASETSAAAVPNSSEVVRMALQVQKHVYWLSIGWSPNGHMSGDCIIYFSNKNATEAYMITGKSASALRPCSTFDAVGWSVNTSDSETTLTFGRRATDGQVKVLPAGTNHMIWAHSSSASFTFHGPNAGSFDVDFASGVVRAVALISTHLLVPTNLYVLHAWLMWLSFGVLFPCGVFVARYAKRWNPGWFDMHVACQGIGVVVSAVPAIIALSEFDGLDGLHGRLGLAILIMVWCQAVLALARPSKTARTRLPWYFVHWLFGTGALFLGLLNVYLGLDVLPSKLPAFGRSPAWKIAFSVQVAIIVFLYVLLNDWRYISSQRAGLPPPPAPSPASPPHPTIPVHSATSPSASSSSSSSSTKPQLQRLSNSRRPMEHP
ncbi:hypothetical protein CBR_g72628 [Chara braunii]|uniref:Cytochrome b561 domain-containing protein n=1 Tax=Chara braunii TaxID=69332 RepID=A0A388K9Y2_CHABU|nr:hypothetical protein CBR_g72628 [Chara braunii]|eukprot:GBG66872.1 hypothetical protein CBR_g72628 [Chara braunii]